MNVVPFQATPPTPSGKVASLPIQVAPSSFVAIDFFGFAAKYGFPTATHLPPPYTTPVPTDVNSPFPTAFQVFPLSVDLAMVCRLPEFPTTTQLLPPSDATPAIRLNGDTLFFVQVAPLSSEYARFVKLISF
jgi:hypothetical protein